MWVWSLNNCTMTLFINQVWTGNLSEIQNLCPTFNMFCNHDQDDGSQHPSITLWIISNIFYMCVVHVRNIPFGCGAVEPQPLHHDTVYKSGTNWKFVWNPKSLPNIQQVLWSWPSWWITMPIHSIWIIPNTLYMFGEDVGTLSFGSVEKNSCDFWLVPINKCTQHQTIR